MTRPWVVASPVGRAPGDHVCWPFRQDDDLVAVSGAYVAEGLARGERVVGYLSEKGLSDLEERLGGGRVGARIRPGQLQLLTLDAMPACDGAVGPAEGLLPLATMTEEALAAGFTGLRMFGDMTGWVFDPAQRARSVAHEHLADRFCLGHAYTALCAYNRSQLGDAVVAELACVHPLAHGGLSPFQLCASPRADLALAGSVDTFSAAALVTALDRIGVPARGEVVVIDAAAVEFVDHRVLVVLDRFAAHRSAAVVLRSAPGLVARLMPLLPLRALRLEETP